MSLPRRTRALGTRKEPCTALAPAPAPEASAGDSLEELQLCRETCLSGLEEDFKNLLAKQTPRFPSRARRTEGWQWFRVVVPLLYSPGSRPRGCGGWEDEDAGDAGVFCCDSSRTQPFASFTSTYWL